ncbi:uncharacterized protein LOC132688459 [Panthera onca]
MHQQMRPQNLAGRGLKIRNKYVNLFAGVAHPDPRATAWAPTGLGPGRISRCTTLRSARPSLRLDPHETQRAQRGSLSLRRGSPRTGETRARRGSPSLRGGYPLPTPPPRPAASLREVGRGGEGRVCAETTPGGVRRRRAKSWGCALAAEEGAAVEREAGWPGGEVIKALQRGRVPQILPGSVPYSAFKTVCNFAFDFLFRPSGVLLPAGVLQFSCILCGRSVRLHLHNGCWGAGSNPGFPPSAGPRSPLPQAAPADFTCTGAAILIRGVRVGHREVSRWGAAACTLNAEKPRRRGAAGHAGTVPPRWAAPSCRAPGGFWEGRRRRRTEPRLD